MNNNRDNLQEKLLLDILEKGTENQAQLAGMSSDIAAIKVNLAEHMKRTELLEKEIKWLHSQVWWVRGTIAVFAFAGAKLLKLL